MVAATVTGGGVGVGVGTDCDGAAYALAGYVKLCAPKAWGERVC